MGIVLFVVCATSLCIVLMVVAKKWERQVWEDKTLRDQWPLEEENRRLKRELARMQQELDTFKQQ